MKFRTTWVLLFLLALMLHTEAFADRNFRCKGKIVSVGDHKSDVLRKCGEPDQVDKWKEDQGEVISHTLDYGKERHRVTKLVKGPIRMERWTYNFGAQTFIRHLTFQKSELIKIETGDKGSN